MIFNDYEYIPEGQTYNPEGKKTREKLNKLGIKSPQGKWVKKDKKTWIVEKVK